MVVARRESWVRWIMGLLACLMLMTTPGDAVAQDLKHISSFGPDGSSSSSFTLIGSIAIDQEEPSVYVLDSTAGELLRFSSDGQPLAFSGSSSYISGNSIEGLVPYTNSSAGTLGVAQVAVNSESHVFYTTEEHAVRAFQANGEPAEFSAGPGKDTSEIPGFAELFGVALDVNGNIYASDRSGSISIFTSAGEPITTISASGPHNVTVSASGAIYAIEDARRIKKFTPDSFPVAEGTIYTESTLIPQNAAGVFMASLALDASSQDIYTVEGSFGGGWVRRYDQAGVLQESIGEPGTPSESESLKSFLSQGIAVLDEDVEVEEGVAIKFYAADSGGDNDSQAALFGLNNPPKAPEVERLRVVDITSDSAALRASINPNSRPTSYRFEYGLGDCSVSVCTSVPLGGAEMGDGHELIAVSQTVLGLAPGTTYHYRVLASNELGEDEEEGTFTTQEIGGGIELSDGRVWEMVSPSNKGGATLRGSRVGQIQAAEDGDELSYLSFGSIQADPDGNRNLEASSLIARRSGGGQWASEDITPPNERTVPLAIGGKSEYKLFSPDLARALVEPRSGTSLSPAASERTPYLRDNTVPPAYSPLVTGKEGFANVPPGTEFGGNPNFAAGGVRLTASNESLTDLVLFSVASLLPGQPDAPPGLYHWSGGDLHPVSVLPSSESSEGEDPIETRFPGSGQGSTWHAISEDGTRVFWGRGSYNNTGNGLTALYLRDTEAEATIRLDVKEADASGAGASNPAFQGASRDGTAVFFTDTRQLTADASASGISLYRCEIPAESPGLGCATLTNLSPAPEGGGESSHVLGLVAGLGEDGATAYFVARGVLDDAANGSGETAIPGGPNLYLWQEGVGVRFITTLSEEDSSVWGITPGEATLTPGETARRNSTVSPSGRYIALMSQKSLTGQQNLDANLAEPVQSVFVYDAVTDKLECVSCNPTGAAPVGQVVAENAALVDPQGIWLGQLVGATLPQVSTMEVFGVSLYQPRVVRDNGRVFINTIDALVPADSNGEWDVYQFEPVGTGGCSAVSASSSSVRSGSGCIGLISSGAAGGPAGFLDASEEGNDVFFLTPARLSVLDKDVDLDVYDARVNGVPAKLAPEVECGGQNCRPGATPPSDPGLGSAFFTGPGNLKGTTKKCPKGKHKLRRDGKTRCVPRKKKGNKHQTGSKDTRRQGR